MLSKKNRVDRKSVKKIFEQGKSIFSSHITFKYLKTGAKTRAISFIAPKSVAKLAVKRNLLRRRGYSALKKYIDQFPSGVVGAFIFKKYQDNVSIIENEIKSTLSKIN